MIGRAAAWLLWALSAVVIAAAPVDPPRADDSVRFAVIGDSGSGTSKQYDLARRLVEARATFPFAFVLMLGDNIYGSDTPKEFSRKFERPYEPLLTAKVPFFAALGNHDDPNQRLYEPFGMGGQRYYTFSRGPATFFVLDTTYLDRAQLDWLERELSGSRARWKVAYGHHPLYSSGAKHGSETDLRALVEPLFVRYGVDVVLAGHEHFYERIHPQQGIYYFTSGAAGKLRKGNIRRGPLTAAGFDQDLSFMLMEITGDDLHFQVVSRTGAIVDRGSLARPVDPPPPSAP
jgi:hypothetical protein